ncbi:MAG TPA: ATP-binding protein [Gemmatimonadales bacterium]|nr:ATP-binding protein [Gemmatimonadales bacterium]
MSFRSRLFLAILLAVGLPLGAFTWGVSHELEQRLTTQYQQRVGTVASIIEADLARESGTIGSRLAALSTEVGRDNRLRLALLQNDARNRQYLLDYAGGAMRLAGLSLLQLQDSTGRILSSGHFRNQFDQLQPELPQQLASIGDTLVLVRARTSDAPLIALTRIDSLRIGGKAFTLIGGIEADNRLLQQLARERELSVSMVYAGVRPDSLSGQIVRAVSLPYLDLLKPVGQQRDTARLVLAQSLEPLHALRRGVTRWFILAVALTLLAATLVAAWLAALVSRPLRQLAEKTSNIDLDRLDQSFDSDRGDEIGSLSRLLGAMTDRLRNSSARLREAERRAAVGDLARQVNHDIKNGLVPIRNVFRHLTQVAKEEPQRLAEVYEARRGTLDSSVEYLETLARHYDRLSPAAERRPCDVNAIIEQVLRSTAQDGRPVERSLEQKLPPVLADELMLRRIVENLVGNALDSTAGRPGGSVTVSTERVGSTNEPERVRIVVSDTGQGMTESELQRAFDDFYSTKPGGTGLGLSIVRRLIMDLNGAIRIETEPGVGTSATVELPAEPSR